MPTVSVWTLRAALAWLALAALLGTALLLRSPLGMPELARYIPAHGELMLVGWMMQLAFGVAHWILPRQPTGAARGATWPVAVAVAAINVGLVCVLAGARATGHALEAGGVVAYALQAFPRIRASGWGATGRAGDLVRLQRGGEVD